MAKEKATTAEQWIKRIDENSPEVMMCEADGEVDENGCSVYIFEDGSSLYEKRRGDWYAAGHYVQCSACNEYFEMPDDYAGGNCADCEAMGEAEDEEATAILKSEVLGE
jgi:hypothetical protein